MNSPYTTISILSLFMASLLMEGGFLVAIMIYLFGIMLASIMLAIKLVEWKEGN